MFENIEEATNSSNEGDYSKSHKANQSINNPNLSNKKIKFFVHTNKSWKKTSTKMGHILSLKSKINGQNNFFRNRKMTNITNFRSISPRVRMDHLAVEPLTSIELRKKGSGKSKLGSSRLSRNSSRYVISYVLICIRSKTRIKTTKNTIRLGRRRFKSSNRYEK